MLDGACLVLRGGEVVAVISGVNVYTACFFIPLVITVYIIDGELRSSLIADCTYTVTLFVVISVFGLKVY